MLEDTTIVYIYVLVDPRDGDVRYVGQTRNTLRRRLSDHARGVGSCYRAYWVQSLVRTGWKPIIRLLQCVLESEANAAERYWISFLKTHGCRLVNSTDGGDGVLNLSEEAKSRISAANKARTCSDATRAKMRASHVGKKHSEETRNKMSVSAKGKPKSDETKRRLSVANKGKGRPHGDGAKKKIADARRGTKWVKGRWIKSKNPV